MEGQSSYGVWPPGHPLEPPLLIKHPVPDRVEPSFIIFSIRALWRSGLAQDAL